MPGQARSNQTLASSQPTLNGSYSKIAYKIASEIAD
jgi:hypothetical protein